MKSLLAEFLGTYALVCAGTGAIVINELSGGGSKPAGFVHPPAVRAMAEAGQMNRYHFPFDDPAHATGTEEEQMAVFRRVREEIRAVFQAYVAGRLDGANTYR
jgi:glycerol uptake facilitator-like aquaporin